MEPAREDVAKAKAGSGDELNLFAEPTVGSVAPAERSGEELWKTRLETEQGPEQGAPCQSREGVWIFS